MVVQAPPDSKNPKQPRSSPVSNISKISSLKRYPDRDYALDLLHQMAKAVAPLIHQYNFKVGLLCEMYPKSPALLGLNVNAGQKILIRLRLPYNDRLFYPMSDLIGTLLHELTHNVHGPHDAKFYRLLDELKAKFEGGSFGASGYVCEENRLGSVYSPFGSTKSVRDKRLEALSKGKYKAESRRLGGSASNQLSMREAALQAAERRLKDSKWCPLADLDHVDLDDALGLKDPGVPEKMKEYKEVIDLTKEENAEGDDEDIEIIEIDACELLLVHKVDRSKLWAKALKPSLEDEASTFLTVSTSARLPEVQVQYRASNSPGKTFIGDEDLYPRRKLVADLDFDQIIEKGKLIQASPVIKAIGDAEEVSSFAADEARTVEKRTKHLPHPEEGLDGKRKLTTQRGPKQHQSKEVLSEAQSDVKKTTKGKKTMKKKPKAKESADTPERSSQKLRSKKPKSNRAQTKTVDKNENKKEVRSISFAELLG